MKLQRATREKADDALRDTLEKAEGREHVRAILRLDPPPGQKAAKPAAAPDPARFESREDYRRAIVHHRSKALLKEQGPTIQRLKDLELAVRGGEMGRTVVVEGPAENLANGVALPGVAHAHLDQEIELIEPRRPGKRVHARKRKPVRSPR